ncbi:MAG: carbohydrate ABC transporter permease [Alphaproteobacteria bacterium]|nr:carbohydrate ABC transporter permease [Alphaproteobacteria bacterium]
MHEAAALRPGPGLRLLTGGFLAFWLVLAAFPLLWIVVMSFKLPIDALAANPLAVVFGPATRAARGGIGLFDLALVVGVGLGAIRAVRVLKRSMSRPVALAVVAVGALLVAVLVVPPLAAALRAIPGLGALGTPFIGATLEHYRAVWFGHGFHRNFVNSLIITAGVVTVSLTVGTLAGYALARTGSRLAFWLLITALIFRALPHSVLVAGYLPPFLNSHALLMPLWQAPVLGDLLQLAAKEPPTLYGQPLAIILVLVSINQPFTIWMLRSFFQTVPTELDEAARVDGCTHGEAFRRVIMPVMWPGVITTGLFSFLLAYNDYLVCALLLDAQSQTMVPAITQFFNRETTSTDQIEAIAAAVSITAPLFLLVMVFQRQIVAGLTAGAVKG